LAIFAWSSGQSLVGYLANIFTFGVVDQIEFLAYNRPSHGNRLAFSLEI
jgi:hypothetical protein